MSEEILNDLQRATHYTVLSLCSNCDAQEQTVIPKGKTFSYFALTAECPGCGCQNTLVKYKLFDLLDR